MAPGGSLRPDHVLRLVYPLLLWIVNLVWGVTVDSWSQVPAVCSGTPQDSWLTEPRGVSLGGGWCSEHLPGIRGNPEATGALAQPLGP